VCAKVKEKMAQVFLGKVAMKWRLLAISSGALQSAIADVSEANRR